MTTSLRFLSGLLLTTILLTGIACGNDERPLRPADLPSATALAATPAAGLKVHPTGTRTGVPIVDAVIAAGEQSDPQKLAALIHYYTLPCENLAMTSVPCAAGQPVGSQSAVFGGGVCEGVFYLRGDPGIPGVLANFLRAPPSARPPAGSVPDLDGRVYAVIKRLVFPREPRIPGEYLIVFASGHVISVDSEGLTWFGLSCGLPASPEAYVTGGSAAPGQTLLLPPR